MDRANLTFQTAPQTVTIGLDQPFVAALADVSLHIGTLIGEVSAMRQMMERLAMQLESESRARQQWDEVQMAMAQQLGMAGSAAYSDAVANAAAQTDDTPPLDVSGQEGAVIEATGPSPRAESYLQSAAGATFAPQDETTLAEVYKSIEDVWFIGDDGRYFIRGDAGAGAPDRRATDLEAKAIKADINKGGRRGRKR